MSLGSGKSVGGGKDGKGMGQRSGWRGTKTETWERVVIAAAVLPISHPLLSLNPLFWVHSDFHLAWSLGVSGNQSSVNETSIP